MISGDRSILEGKKGAFYSMLQEFSLHWNRVDIICPRPSSSAKQALSLPENVHFHPSPHGLLLQSFWIRRKGKELSSSSKFDVMTVHEYPPFYNGIGAWMLKRATGVPYALEIHHIVGCPIAASLKEKIGYLLTRLFIRFDAIGAAAVRTVNMSAKERLSKLKIPEKKLHVVSSFYLDRELLESIPNVPIKYDVSFCARLVENKGFAEVIDAITLMKDVRMVVIGDGPERAKMEKKVKDNGVQDRIDFVGWLSDQRVVMETIKSAKIFVMNSKSEGGPRVLLEAMGCGMPVIATPVGIVPDVIEFGKNGILTTGNVQNLAVRIQTLLRDENQRKKIGEEARKVLDRFERLVLIQAYADFLKSLA